MSSTSRKKTIWHKVCFLRGALQPHGVTNYLLWLFVRGMDTCSLATERQSGQQRTVLESATQLCTMLCTV